MKRVMVKSIFDAFKYVMQHFYPIGLEGIAEKSDTYAVISIQDSYTDGFGITFSENKYCKGSLILQFDDIIHDVEGAVLFSEEMAIQIIEFIRKYQSVDTLLINCYNGQSRSRAIGAFAVWLLDMDDSECWEKYNLNTYVYDKLMETVFYVNEHNSNKYILQRSIFDPVLTERELEEIIYTGTEVENANMCIEKFCNRVPAKGFHLGYLSKAEELAYLYGEMLLILEDDITTENKKRLAILACEMAHIVDIDDRIIMRESLSCCFEKEDEDHY